MASIPSLSPLELAKHNQPGNLWIRIHEHVYNISTFIHDHPGGEEILRAFAGKDATEAFDDVAHSDEATPIMHSLVVGRIASLHHLDPNTSPPLPLPSQKSQLESPQRPLVPKVESNQTAKKTHLISLFTAIVVLKLTLAAPLFAFFLLVGTVMLVALLLYGFMAVTSRHRVAEEYPDYIKARLP